MWHEDFGGLPSEEFLTTLDPLLAGLRERLYRETYTCDVAAGNLNPEWAERLGLSTNVIVGTGAFDAHMGAIGTEVKPHYVSKVMGTSTCDMLVTHKEEGKEKLVKGMCGQVDGSIVPGMLGLEAGQSAFGDIYNWFRNILEWPLVNLLAESRLVNEETSYRLIEEISGKLIARLGEEAEKISPAEGDMVALDWMNGRRTPDADPNLKGAIMGLTLGSDAPRIFRALVEATAFGSKAINERLKNEGVQIDGIIALGGVAKKSPFVMQVMADVLNMPVKVARSEHACALGAAMAAAVVSGICSNIAEAQKQMGGGAETEYFPVPANVELYEKRYEKYRLLGNFIETQFLSPYK
jgi:L-ribulokinase